MLRQKSARKMLVSVACALLLLTAACSSDTPRRAKPDRAPSTSPDASSPASPPAPVPSTSPTPTSAELRSEARRAKANELGVVPVLMYHRVFPGASGEYDLTPEEFRGELKRLWREGYVPVRTIDLVSGDLDVPAGKSPVVLTFDDSSVEQFGYTKKGDVDRRTAIGILLDFAAKHDGFPATASLYVNQRPFNSSDYPKMLRDLHRRGFELGNHTLEHRDLRSSSPTEVQRQLALGRKVITDAVPDAEVLTLSLPLGIAPEPARLAWSGRWRGMRYEHKGILLVGWRPSPSPFVRAFDPHAILRVRSAQQQGPTPTYGSEYWLDYLKKNPGERYVSDGEPQTIAFPKKLRRDLAPRFRRQALAY